MKHNIKYVFALAFMLLMTQGAWADPTVTIIKQLNGTTVTTTSPGDVTPEIANGKCTLTVIPAQGNYVTKDFITAYSVVSGDMAQAPRRTNPNLDNDPIEVSNKGENTDPAGTTTYEFTMPTDGSNVEVSVDFQTRKSISDAVITLAETSYTYDGTEKKPSVSSVVLGETTLGDSDYEVSYSDNVNAGENAAVTVTGLRQYTGTASTTFTILPKSITSDMITLSPSSLVYCAESQTPGVTVTDGNKLTEETDYSISYQQVNGQTVDDVEETRDVATYNVVVTGQGNYTGSATKSFEITKAPLENLSVSLEGWTYGEQPEEIEPTVEGYEEEGDMSFYYKVKDADDNTYLQDVPENAGEYTIKVVVAETANYAAGSATADFTIAKAPLNDPEFERELTVSITGWKYGATPNTPSVDGNLGNGAVTYTYKDAENEQAEFSETVPTNAGSYLVKATVAETDNYLGGEAEDEFTIEKGDLSLTVSCVDLTYDGTAQQLITITNVPEGATVKYYCQAIDQDQFEDEDFELLSEPDPDAYVTTVPSSTDAGYFALLYMVDGGDNYNNIYPGELIKVDIYPAEITELTLSKTTLPYNGEEQTVIITSVKAGNLVLGTNDYTVTLNGEDVTDGITAKAVGEYTVEVTGKGNFKNSKSATFSIVNRTLAKGEVTFHNHWATFYSADGDVELPGDIGAFIVKDEVIDEKTVTVTPIQYIPEGVAVLLSNDANVVTQTDNTSAAGNMLRHADNAIVTDDYDGLIYGLYNGTFMRVSGTIPAGKNYLVAYELSAPELTIVFDGGSTGINDVRSKKADVSGDFYDLQGRKVQKPSKKGLYINEGHKVVVK